MPVHAAELDLLSVEIHNTVPDLDVPQHHMLGDALTGCFQHKRITIGIFRVPKHRIGNLQLQGAVLRNLLLGQAMSLGILQANAGLDSITLKILKRNRQLCPILCNSGLNPIVPDGLLRPLQKIYVPENAAHAKLILILQVGAVAPLQHQHCQRIVALPDKIRHIKFTGRVGNLVVAHIRAVQPDIIAAVHTFKNEMGPGRLRIPLIAKVVHIGTAGIVLGHIGWIKGEGIANVGILRHVEAVKLPESRHRKLCETGGSAVISILIKGIVQRINALIIMELPAAVQKLQPIRLLPLHKNVIHPPGGRDVVSPGRQGVLM